MPQITNITLLLLTHNEEGRVDTNFKWLKNCPNINEIIVVDDNSTDKTINILKKLNSKTCTLKIYSRGLEDDFASQRNFGITKCTNDWILWLDPDEIPDSLLIKFLKNFTPDSPIQNYGFIRQDIFLEKPLKHGEAANLKTLRLFNKNYGMFIGKVHEIWQSNGRVKTTDLIIYHHSHQNLSDFWQKINLYSTIRAQELFQSNQKVELFDIIFYPIGKFLNDYFFKLSLLDGTRGMIFSLTMSFYSFLVRAKLWHLQQQ